MTRALLLSLLLPGTLVAQFPAQPPEALPSVPARELKVTESVLANGLRLVVIPQPRHAVLSIALTIPAGTVYDPAGKEGTADLLTRLLPRGAGNRSASDIATTIENLGGSLAVADDPDAITMQVDLTANYAATAFELLGDMVIRPTLDSTLLAGYRQEALGRLALEQEDPATIASRVFLIGTYRQHPYGRRPTPQSVRTIQHRDVLAFYRARVRPAGSVLVVSGDITPAVATQLATRYLATWKGVRGAPITAPAPGTSPGNIYLIHQGGERTASIILGNTTFAATDSGYAVAAVLNQLLGETGGSRLNQALAVQRGWTDVVQSAFLRTNRLGLFQVTAETPSSVADSTVREIQAQLERLRTDLVPARELDRAKEAARGAAAMRVQTVSQLSATMAQLRLAGLPAASFSATADRISKVTAAQVRALARRVFDPANLVLVVVGDAAKLGEPLQSLGPVRLFATDGRPLTAADVRPKDVAFTFDTTQIVPRVDSLAILSQGQVVGLQVARITRGSDSVGYSERTSLGPQFNQVSGVTLDTRGRMRAVEQTGTVRGQNTKIALRYAGTRVKGEARVMAAEGPKTLTVDTDVPAFVVDDNAIQAMLPWLDWALNRRWTLPVFASGENVVRNQTLTVSNIETVRTPVGDFEAYRADLDGGPQLVSFYVTTATPHRLVRVTIEGSPLEFLAVNR